ncbi:MAG: TraB/GumN family protein [Pseudoflavonifractor sp.]|nr:TraB/GumN family protein [Alloprevotella sp.]MCM1117199.1 TraB/GumN family protein [Pseudoflavonifractor sp.]
MKRIITLIIGALCIGSAANAQLLWKVEGNGLAKPSYIFGTHHVAPADMTSRVPGLFDAIEEAEGVVGEVDMTNLNPMEMQQMMLPHIMAPADSTLSKVFTPAQLDSIASIFSSYTGAPVDLTMMDGMKPVMISSQLAILQSMKAFPGFDPSEQLDQTLQKMAAAAGKSVEGLETFEYQMGVLYDTPIATQADDLMAIVRDDAKAVREAGELAGAYTSYDLDLVEKILYDNPEMTPDKIEKLLLERNRAWAAKLPEMMASKSLLVAVGCGHLPGSEGLLNLLRRQGYEVTPVKYYPAVPDPEP